MGNVGSRSNGGLGRHTPVVLDHDEHPRVFELILKNSSCAVLGVMRCTSHEVRRQVAIELGRRMSHVMTVDTSDDPDAVHAVAHRSMQCDGFCKLHSYPLGPQSSLSQVRVVDIDSTTPPFVLAIMDADLRKQQVDMVRLRALQSVWRGKVPIVASTFVLFVGGGRSSGVQVPHPWSLIPNGVRKVVFSIETPVLNWNSAVADVIGIPLPQSVHKVVILFPNQKLRTARDIVNKPRLNDYLTLPDASRWIFAELIENMVLAITAHAPRVRYTIVGLDNLAPSLLRLTSETTPEKDILARVAKQGAEDGDDSCQTVAAIAAVRFRTAKEHRRQVGANEYALQTQWWHLCDMSCCHSRD